MQEAWVLRISNPAVNNNDKDKCALISSFCNNNGVKGILGVFQVLQSKQAVYRIGPSCNDV